MDPNSSSNPVERHLRIACHRNNAGTEGTGCSFLFPLIDKCPTQPLVTIRNVTLENINLENSYLIPGVILGPKENPFSNFNFMCVWL